MNKVRIDLIGSEDGALLDVIEIDQTLFRQGQRKASGYGITLTEYLEFCFRGLQQLRLKHCTIRRNRRYPATGSRCFSI